MSLRLIREEKTLDAIDRVFYDDPDVRYFLGELRRYRPVAYHHSMRLGYLAPDLAQECGFSDEEDLTEIARCALLHDVGKLRVRREVVEKRGPLTDAEFLEMKWHARHGFDILRDPRYGDKFSIESRIAVGHHEHSTRPYPRTGLVDQAILDRRKTDERVTKITQIVAVVDMLDALGNVRGYKKAWDYEDIARTLPTEFTGPKEYAQQALLRI